MMNRLGVGSYAIRHAYYAGVIPAAWYAEVAALAEKAGVECPLSAFSFKGNTPAPVNSEGAA